MRCLIEIGRVGILTEVSCLFQHLCSPRELHLDYVYSIFRYLQKNLGKNQARMIYETMYEPTDENLFGIFGRDLYKWKYFYPDSP